MSEARPVAAWAGCRTPCDGLERMSSVVEQVIPNLRHSGAVAALHKLQAARFLRHKNREEVDATPVDLDLPFEADEVSGSPRGIGGVIVGCLGGGGCLREVSRGGWAKGRRLGRLARGLTLVRLPDRGWPVRACLRWYCCQG